MAYNGWSNYETWCVNLWVTNSKCDLESIQEQARDLLQNSIDKGINNNDAILNDAACELADYLKDTCTYPISDIISGSNMVSGLYLDMLQASFNAVNWYEIAIEIVSNIPIYVAGWNIPGYLPDSDPCLFVSIDNARSYIIDEINRQIDCDEDSVSAQQYENAAKQMQEEPGEFGYYVNGMFYFVQEV